MPCVRIALLQKNIVYYKKKMKMTK